MPNDPQYPFGYGLSYTTFTYDSIRINRKEFSPADPIDVSIRITNTGNRAGEEIVQLYVRDVVGSVTRPVKELKGFEKIKLAAGESKIVNFKLTPDDLAFHTADMKFAAEPGEYRIMIGPNSAQLQTQVVKVIR